MTKANRDLVTGGAVALGVLAALWFVRKTTTIPVLPPSAIKWDTAK